MLNLDLSFTITAIIALCALISPIVTTVLNNRHKLKIRKLELEHEICEHKIEYLRSVYNNYLKSTSKCIAYPDEDSLREYGENYSISFAYFPPSTHELLKAINADITERNFDSANKNLEDLSIFLASLMKSL